MRTIKRMDTIISPYILFESFREIVQLKLAFADALANRRDKNAQGKMAILQLNRDFSSPS